MGRSNYVQRMEGEGFVVDSGRIFRLECCDCGLVHDFIVTAAGMRKGTKLGMAARRNKRATAQRRRKRIEKKEG